MDYLKIIKEDELAKKIIAANSISNFKLNEKIKIEGYTIIPIKLYFKKNYAKLLIGLAKGKKNYDSAFKQIEKERVW